MQRLTSTEIQSSETLVVTNEVHRFMALEQLRESSCENATLLLESCSRNTAPALTLAALHATKNGADPVLVVSPADQLIEDGASFQSTLRQSITLAADGNLVVLGIQPDSPATGFGYIHAPQPAAPHVGRPVLEFTEKPDAATAWNYLQDDGYHWNSGMFILKASSWLATIQSFRPDILDATMAAWSHSQIDDRFNGPRSHYTFERPDADAFASIPAESIDYAVIESCPGSSFPILMLPLDCAWSDLGAWDAVWQVGEHDDSGNVTHGNVLLESANNSLVHASSRLVAMADVDNLIVVETPDAVLITNREHSQNVKKLVAKLEQMKRPELSEHRKVHRPWGWYDSLAEESRFKVKRIMVKPGASLSLQKHHHRAEHWIVVKGTAEIRCGQKTSLLTENQSTYIPLGEEHKLSNPGSIPLEIIEIQSGSYLGEDDIVRFDDCYGRVK